MGELLSKRLAVVVVPVQREAARRHVPAGLEAPRRQVVALDAGAGRVLPVDVAHGVGVPAEFLGPAADVEPRLELGKSGGLTVADGIDRERVLAWRRWPRALEGGELKLGTGRAPGGDELPIEIDPREAPAHHAPRAIAQRECDVNQGNRHLGEQRRPVLADPQGGAAVREVGIGQAGSQPGLLVTEGREVLAAEEIGLDHAPGGPGPQDRLTPEVEAEAGVPDVAVGEGFVGRELGLGGPFRVLSLAEAAEALAVREERGVDEAADGERLARPQFEHFLGGGGTRFPEHQGDCDPGEPPGRRSHGLPLAPRPAAAHRVYPTPHSGGGPLWRWIRLGYPLTAPIAKPSMKRSIKRL